MRPRTPSRLPVLALSSVFLLALLAGCTAGGGDQNVAPHARLEVDDDNGYTGEEFTFDGRGSEDSDGEIASYTFDFGDGSPNTVVTEEDQAEVSHVYTKGGQYTVTLTVKDDGKENTGSRSDDESINVIVNERVPVAIAALDALGDNNTGEEPFEVHKDANRFDMNLTVRSALLTGSSEFEIRVVGPDGEAIAEKKVTVDPGTQGQTVTLDGLLTQQGTHAVEVEALSGGGTAEGELRVIYGEDLGG
jgi:PKD repeat protein